MLDLKDSSRKRKTVAASAFELQDDKFTGFIEAVDNGQARLALEYMVYLLTEINNEVFHLQAQVEKLKDAPVVAKSKPEVAKKAVKKIAKQASAANETGEVPNLDPVIHED